MATNRGIAHQRRKNRQIVPIVKTIARYLAILFRPELTAFRRRSAKNFLFGFLAFIAQMHVGSAGG